MKSIFKSRPFKLAAAIVGFLLLGALIGAANGHGESAQSAIVGTVLSPCNYIAQKISDGVDKIAGNISGDAQYEKEISDLQNQVGELQSELVDYENLKKQNELYKEFLGLKEENKDFVFEEASVIARDSADIYKSFTISKGSVSGMKKGDAVLYGKYLVGVIDKVYPTYSEVQTILNPAFNVSAYEVISGEISYVTSTPALAADNKCKFANLDSSTSITYESVVCTAGVGGNMPKGLIIGTVDEIADEATDISSYAVIKPGVDANNINTCFVLTDF
ncbi:rod shape-determining protein MreC [uncultured Eubacterium sp.]|uniref:rod shape-determining protein MreC n=1 Tax=uncultured Eubacterium sp. TaxID=165185 RepID=UPI0015ABD920|nr:rod shape-determining protein MreC [uncultured Eubacterium sp.]